jgi:hypothetical protein
LDEDFQAKYTQEARELGNQIGYPERLAQLEWRSHWGIPSNTALYEMLHRLYKPYKLPGDPVEYPAVTLEDVRRAVKTNDMSPGWVAPLLAVSYRPLSLTDVRRGFEIGLIKEDELVDRFRAVGSSPEDAEILKQFTVREAGPNRARREGQIPRDEVLRYYREGIMGRADAKASLALAGVPSEYVDQYLSTEDYRRQAQTQRVELASIRKRFLRGEFQLGEAVGLLVGSGYDATAAAQIVRRWDAELRAKYKAATVKMLCRWWTDGILTADQFRTRVRNLGYPLDDALRIAQTCQTDNLQRQAKEAERLAKQAATEERRRRAEQKAAAKEAEKLRLAAMPCKPPPKPTCGEAPDQSPGWDG